MKRAKIIITWAELFFSVDTACQFIIASHYNNLHFTEGLQNTKIITMRPSEFIKMLWHNVTVSDYNCKQ